MRVTIHNDGKKKDFSFEANLELGTLTGWGKTKADAIANLNLALYNLKKEISNTNLYKDAVEVDWAGVEIGKYK